MDTILLAQIVDETIMKLGNDVHNVVEMWANDVDNNVQRAGLKTGELRRSREWTGPRARFSAHYVLVGAGLHGPNKLISKLNANNAHLSAANNALHTDKGKNGQQCNVPSLTHG